MVDFVKALDEFIDICNTGKSEYEKIWKDHSVRAMVRKCVAILTRLAYPNDAKKIVKADWLFIMESLTLDGTLDENVNEFIAQCKKYANHDNTIMYPYNDGHEAIVSNVRDLCLEFVTQKDHDSETLEKLAVYQATWFPKSPVKEYSDDIFASPAKKKARIE